MEEKVSIIVPIYNSEQFLHKCLDSIINQTYKNLEIILVNDGSTDSSLKILEEYAQFDPRIVLINQVNGGIGTAYKAAFNIMTGDSVFFVDSDDWLELNAMESLVGLRQQYNADYVAMNMTFTKALPEHTYYIKDELVEDDDIMQRQFAHYQHSSICRLHRKELFKNVTVYDQNIGIDAQLTPQLLHNAKRGYITSKSYYNTLVRQGSISRSLYVTEKQIKDTVRVYQFIISFMEQNISSYTDFMRSRYIDSLLAMCKSALFVSNKDAEPHMPLILGEMEKNYVELRKGKLYNTKRKIDRIQLWLIINFKKCFNFFVHSGILTKLGLYK